MSEDYDPYYDPYREQDLSQGDFSATVRKLKLSTFRDLVQRLPEHKERKRGSAILGKSKRKRKRKKRKR